MSVTVTWKPNTEPNIYNYDIQRAPDVSGIPGTWVDLVTISHDLNGPNYDDVSQRFFYVDSSGNTNYWYHLRARDTNYNVSGWSTHFKPSSHTTPPPFPNSVTLYKDYPTLNNLQLTNLDGVPIVGAQVRVYKKLDWDLADYGAVYGSTTTIADAAWLDPVFVEPGITYVIQFFKPGVIGPKTIEIVVP